MPGEVGGKFLADLKPQSDYDYQTSYEDRHENEKENGHGKGQKNGDRNMQGKWLTKQTLFLSAFKTYLCSLFSIWFYVFDCFFA